MKKIIFFLLAACVFSSCSFNSYEKDTTIDDETYMLLSNYSELFNSINNKQGSSVYVYEVKDSLVLLNENTYANEPNKLEVSYGYAHYAIVLETIFNNKGVSVVLNRNSSCAKGAWGSVFLRALHLIEQDLNLLASKNKKGMQVTALDDRTLVVSTFTGKEFYIDVIRH